MLFGMKLKYTYKIYWLQCLTAAHLYCMCQWLAGDFLLHISNNMIYMSQFQNV